ncbi:MAG: polyisoprenyl-phosphate glycosyltransferase [Verrucomicrobiota bacterium]|jgi:glycosyltransferase involved in cell wall biosynthesis
MQELNQRFISIVTPCYNEEGNVEELYRQIRDVLATLPEYTYEHIYIDNASSDGTLAILRRLAGEDKRVKVIINVRNFGHIRSPVHAYFQARGEAVIVMVSDLQDPPALITDFLKKWEEGFKIVLGQKSGSAESGLMFRLRKLYYRLVSRMSDVKLLENVTGFGLYDREVVEQIRALDDAYPYVRGLISELGYPVARIPYRQPNRKTGITKNNFYTLYDMAMLGFTSHSKIPLRLATMLGFAMSLFSFLVAVAYFIYKLLNWNSFPVGQAPIVIGLFLFSSVQLFFIGIVGEYIGAIHTQILHRPLVVEKERINF